jgi:hypothetical protein
MDHSQCGFQCKINYFLHILHSSSTLEKIGIQIGSIPAIYRLQAPYESIRIEVFVSYMIHIEIAVLMNIGQIKLLKCHIFRIA